MDVVRGMLRMSRGFLVEVDGRIGIAVGDCSSADPQSIQETGG
jgi:hypothetical protein